jgi:hypothetical protein
VAQAGGLAGADAVLHAGVRAVAGFEELGVGAGGVGGQELVAPPVGGLEQGELRAGLGFFAAGDDAQVSWPARQLVTAWCVAQQGGELDDARFPGVAGLALGVKDSAPARYGNSPTGSWASCTAASDPDLLRRSNRMATTHRKRRSLTFKLLGCLSRRYGDARWLLGSRRPAV